MVAARVWGGQRSLDISFGAAERHGPGQLETLAGEAQEAAFLLAERLQHLGR